MQTCRSARTIDVIEGENLQMMHHHHHQQQQQLQPSAMPSRLCSGGCNLAKITAAAPDPGVPGDSGPQLT